MSSRSMSGGVPRHALSSLVALFAMSTSAHSEDTSLARAVPADLLFFAECKNVKAVEAELKASEHWQFLNDPACAGLMRVMEDALAEVMASISEETTADIDVLLKSATGRAAVYSYMLAEKALDDPRPQEEEPEAMGLLLDIVEDHEAFAAEVEKLMEKDLASGELTREQREVEGIDVAVFVRNDESGPEELGYGFAGNTFFLVLRKAGSQVDAFSDIIRGLRGELESTLADAPQFKSALGDDPSDIGMYFGWQSLLKRELARDEALGLPIEAIQRDAMESIGALTMTMDFGSSVLDSSQRFHWASDSKLLRMLRAAFPVGKSKLMSRVPEKAFVAASFQVDVEEFMNLVIEIGSESVGQSPAEMRAEMEANFEQDGFHVKHEILDNLGGEIAFFLHDVQDEMEALPDTEDDPFNFAVLIALQDSQGIETALDALLRKEGLHAIRERKEFEGQAYFSVPTPLGIKAYYALLPDCAVIAGSSELMVDVLRRSGNSDLPTLAKDVRFVAAMEHVGVEQTGFYAMDLPRILPLVLEELFLEIDPSAQAPDEAVFRKYFKGHDVVAGRLAEDEIVIRSVHIVGQ